MKRTLLVVPVVLVAACGGGSSAGSGGVSKADYLKKAEAICAKANTARDDLKTPSGASELAPYVARLVDLAAEATGELTALEAPEADLADLDKKVLDPLAQQVQEGRVFAEQVAAAARGGEQVKLVKLLSNPPTTTQADLAWMRKYGFTQCVDAADTGS